MAANLGRLWSERERERERARERARARASARSALASCISGWRASSLLRLSAGCWCCSHWPLWFVPVSECVGSDTVGAQPGTCTSCLLSCSLRAEMGRHNVGNVHVANAGRMVTFVRCESEVFVFFGVAPSCWKSMFQPLGTTSSVCIAQLPARHQVFATHADMHVRFTKQLDLMLVFSARCHASRSWTCHVFATWKGLRGMCREEVKTQARTTQRHQGFGELDTWRVKEEDSEMMRGQVGEVQAADPRSHLAAHEIVRLLTGLMSTPWGYMMSS